MAKISRRAALGYVAAAVTGTPAMLRGRFPVVAQSPDEYSSRAMRLMEETPVVDLLNQFMFAHLTEQPPKITRWLQDPATFTEADRVIYRGSGIDVFALGAGGGNYDATIRFFAQWNGFLAGASDQLLRIGKAGDFARVHRERKIGVMLTVQDSTHFRGPYDVDLFFSLGQRISQLTYNFSNGIGSGFLEQRDGGLTIFGLSILKRMEAVGMGVDVSHCGDQTTLDALDAASKPILFTHATCRALVQGHLRAKTDEMIRKMASTGGLMGIDLIRFLVRDREPVTIEHVLDHFDYVRKLVGIQHLAIGSDLDITGNAAPQGAPGQPPNSSASSQPNYERYREHTDPNNPSAVVTGLRHPKRMFDLTEGLIKRGYSDSDIEMILGGNAVRVLEKIWSAGRPG